MTIERISHGMNFDNVTIDQLSTNPQHPANPNIHYDMFFNAWINDQQNFQEIDEVDNAENLMVFMHENNLLHNQFDIFNVLPENFELR